MSVPTTVAPSRHPATPAQLEWLDRELATWLAEGLLDRSQADGIRERYRAEARLSIGRLILTIGAVFIGIGVVWLVGANLDALSPLARFVAITVFWLGTTLGAEHLALRHDRDRASPLVGSVRLMAALAFGAVIFQAAQSLQVPAYSAGLLGWWSLGALAHAYAVRAVLPLVVAILTGAGWLLWAALPQSENGTTAVVLLAAVGVLGAAASVLHTRWAPELAAPWRETAAAFLLIGLFVAALPWVPEGPAVWTTSLVLAVGAASALAAAAVLRPAPGRWEILGALAAGVSAVLVALAPQSDSGLDRAGESVAAGDVLVAVASMALFVAVAVGVAVVGTLRDSWRLTATATLALVVFTTVQSFSVFALILEGSLLFMALGLVLVGTGVGFDRVRRRLAAAVLDDRAGADR